MRTPAIPARMHSRTIRRTAMIPPWPVSPSMMTGNCTACAIHPATVTHSSMVSAPTSDSPVYAPTTPPVPTKPTSQPAFSMIRAQAAFGGCSTDSTRSVRLINWRKRVVGRAAFAVPSFECIASSRLTRRRRYTAPQLTHSSVSNYGATINEMMFHDMERRRSCLRHRPRPRAEQRRTSSSRRSASTTLMKDKTVGSTRWKILRSRSRATSFFVSSVPPAAARALSCASSPA